MRIIEVSPISHKIGKDTLTYFSSKNVAPGDIVSIEVRKKNYDALVLSVREAKDLKAELRGASFGMKKVLKVHGRLPLRSEFFRAILRTREYFAGNLGQIIASLVPAAFLENFASFPKTPPISNVRGRASILSLQDSPEGRLEFHKKFIRKHFSLGKSVFLCLPTINEAKNFYKLLRSDLNNSFLFYGSLPEKKLLEAYEEIIASEDPVLVVMTPGGLFLPRGDLGAIILEHESSSHYKTERRPYFDARLFAKFLAEEESLDFLFSDTILSLETSFEAVPSQKANWSTNLSAKMRVVNMKEEKSKNFVFSDETILAVKNCPPEQEKSFSFHSSKRTRD